MRQAGEVVAARLEMLAISELTALESAGIVSETLFTPAERAYAESKRDPERRLAARLAAKRATASLLGDRVTPEDIEVRPARGAPPELELSAGARHRLEVLGASRALLSLTHGRTHVAAAVLLVRP
jgi:phosphopantetheinyl transferase (holo-ACP synthase)